ncbi:MULTISPECIES: PhnD/SsuA/transferrin family substrate-binding protein [unclassified Mesorhizobium]|uniref:phosphate/phosphite/phosphonate ABC transporter substrate-binding protein n=1 Tax=unclassified Mesorhizobium TaxID=325217 RepID=UPI000FCC6C2D|nr:MULTISPECIES: PhnD/SsuA/transferrin family substrate-binding protein [unclassified Mesorhizobium]MDG4886305.1 PhnD/SsuA/transferrin family substrate-binding protein [Mesorhizobium sp. WSM4887]RUW00503.1 phosphate ABC transporter substrate-binding protein [Mesorhizobium sp. M1A.F.Ca.IN.020.04.1.1]RWG18198.1 MAG: phosphate ABC transporter substrate-binding protein [Mesorhizobium sp.]RWG36451.1 MAG: phosphate ABC transporter substrate-binding protein [Mesorhizobium sp.]RWH16323.1 MAG: phosphat
MSKLIAALPMYDWPEVRGEIDAQWAQLRDAFRRRGIDAPERMARSNRDLPPVSGGIQDGAGKLIAPDPATLPPDEFDFHQLWLSPALLFGQTCWGPMELGLARHVQVVAQPSYDAFEGGQGELYSSALVMPADGGPSVGSPADGKAVIPLDLIRGKRFIFNNPDSMSGLLGLTRDLEAIGESLGVFASCGESGGHRSSIVAIAEGRADIAAIDCQSWALAQRFEPAARRVKVVGWTTRRKGLPFISARATSADVVASMREAIAELGLDGSVAKQLFVERVG